MSYRHTEPEVSAVSDACDTNFRRPNAYGVYEGKDGCESIDYASKHVQVEVLVLQTGVQSWAVGYDCDVGNWSGMCSGVSEVKACRSRTDAFAYGLAIVLHRLGPTAAGADDGTYGVTDGVRRNCRYAIESLLGQVAEEARRKAVAQVVDWAGRG